MKYYTVQNTYTINSLAKSGEYTGTLNTTYFIEDLFKAIFNNEGLVLYSVIEDDMDIPFTGFGEYLIELRQPKTENKFEIIPDLYHRTKVLIDSSDECIVALKNEYDIDKDYFNYLSQIKGSMYVGICDKITRDDVISVRKINNSLESN